MSSNGEVAGMVNRDPEEGPEMVVITDIITWEEGNEVESAHEILRKLAERGVTAEYVDADHIKIHFPGNEAILWPGDVLTLYRPMGEDD